jgi:hypothetical protein
MYGCDIFSRAVKVRPEDLTRKMVEEVKKEAEFAHKLHHQNILIVCGTHVSPLFLAFLITYSTTAAMALFYPNITSTTLKKLNVVGAILNHFFAPTLNIFQAY